jgi:hypothetical protein
MKTTAKKHGSALVLVLIMGALFATLSATLFMRYNSQKKALTQIDEHQKADWVAKGMVQLMLFKIKLLPSAFYSTDGYHKTLIAGGNVDGADIFINSWYDDFCQLDNLNFPLEHTGLTRLGQAYINSLPAGERADYQVWVRGCSLVRKSVGGYEKDFLRVNIDVRFRGILRKYEELVQIDRYAL